jgi:hypothetical protein
MFVLTFVAIALPFWLITAMPQTRAEYPGGIYGIWPVDRPLSNEILANEALEGIFLTGGGKWSVVEPVEDVYDFSLYDERLSEAAQFGKRIVLALPHNAKAAPDWLRDQVTQFATIKDGCNETAFPVFWDEAYRQERLELIREFGRRYAENEHVVAVTASFAGTKTGDWNLNFSKGECNGVRYDNGQQWLDAGYSTALMLEIGKEVVAATAQAFPNQALKISLGVSPVDTAGVTKYTLADSIASFGSDRYPERFYVQMSNLNLNSPRADDPDVAGATPSSRRYLQKILADHAPFMGWQLVDSATQPGSRCRLGGGISPCPPAEQLMNDVLDIALTYQPHFIEIWQVDATNPALTDLLKEKSASLITSITETPAGLPGVFMLRQNYPNPFNPETVIGFQLSAVSEVELAVFDITGRRVRTLVRGRQSSGAHSVIWDGRDERGQAVASGIYLYRLVAGKQVRVRRLAVVR